MLDARRLFLSVSACVGKFMRSRSASCIDIYLGLFPMPVGDMATDASRINANSNCSKTTNCLHLARRHTHCGFGNFSANCFWGRLFNTFVRLLRSTASCQHFLFDFEPTKSSPTPLYFTLSQEFVQKMYIYFSDKSSAIPDNSRRSKARGKLRLMTFNSLA